MIHTTGPDPYPESPGADSPIVGPESTSPAGEANRPELCQLLAQLKAPARNAVPDGSENDPARLDNHLAMVRLGMASSLFFALRTKHAPTAAHSLRVAIACSAWAECLEVEAENRDRIEVAALLHDVGKIGIPDRILRKPGRLSVDEQLSMDACPELGCEILLGCTDDQQLLKIVRYASQWFRSRRQSDGPRGSELPLGARMLAIADAFDAMTTDHAYRPAMSRESALRELIRGSGTQFDPDLVSDYRRLLDRRPELLEGPVADRWLGRLQPGAVDALWGGLWLEDSGEPQRVRRDRLFLAQLADSLPDGIAFTDNEGTITRWNGTMERLTSIKADAVLGQTWQADALRLRDADGSAASGNCPLEECLRLTTTVSRSMAVAVGGRDPVPVQVHVSPVVGEVPGTHGAVVVVRDLSAQSDLEQQLETLHERATRDGLTGVANRGEFDQRLEGLVDASAAGGETFSLIICDIDHFKWVNDTHGHPAGDEALICFASVLSRHSRGDDLVARYGGEEFVLLAPRCDQSTAADRAEAIRHAVETTPLSSLGGEVVTASFGVTEFQAGDSAETILARADRALLQAKDEGRNRVVHLGGGKRRGQRAAPPRRSFWKWWDTGASTVDSEIDLISSAPTELVIEKLRGFIADHHAEILDVVENQVTIRLAVACRSGGRRSADGQVMLRVQLTLSELAGSSAAGETRAGATRTKVHVLLQPVRHRDRRRREWKACLDQVIASLRSYLMGELVREAEQPSASQPR